MVGTLLGLSTPPPNDHASDALAVAICHAAQSPVMLAPPTGAASSAAEAAV
jgi:Holliday junction resolvasome RuvABC endonuclease subunit